MSGAMDALYAGDRKAALRLLRPDGELSVFEAAAFGREARLEELLGDDPSLATAFSHDGFTALHVAPLGTAAFVRSVSLAELLLDAGADPNGGEKDGFTPLHSAAQSGDEPLVQLLVERGADPARATSEGVRPLDLVATDDVRRRLST